MQAPPLATLTSEPQSMAEALREALRLLRLANKEARDLQNDAEEARRRYQALIAVPAAACTATQMPSVERDCGSPRPSNGNFWSGRENEVEVLVEASELVNDVQRIEIQIVEKVMQAPRKAASVAATQTHAAASSTEAPTEARDRAISAQAERGGSRLRLSPGHFWRGMEDDVQVLVEDSELASDRQRVEFQIVEKLTQVESSDGSPRPVPGDFGFGRENEVEVLVEASDLVNDVQRVEIQIVEKVMQAPSVHVQKVSEVNEVATPTNTTALSADAAKEAERGGHSLCTYGDFWRGRCNDVATQTCTTALSEEAAKEAVARVIRAQADILSDQACGVAISADGKQFSLAALGELMDAAGLESQVAEPLAARAFHVRASVPDVGWQPDPKVTEAAWTICGWARPLVGADIAAAVAEALREPLAEGSACLERSYMQAMARAGSEDLVHQLLARGDVLRKFAAILWQEICAFGSAGAATAASPSAGSICNMSQMSRGEAEALSASSLADASVLSSPFASPGATPSAGMAIETSRPKSQSLSLEDFLGGALAPDVLGQLRVRQPSEGARSEMAAPSVTKPKPVTAPATAPADAESGSRFARLLGSLTRPSVAGANWSDQQAAQAAGRTVEVAQQPRQDNLMVAFESALAAKGGAPGAAEIRSFVNVRRAEVAKVLDLFRGDGRLQSGAPLPASCFSDFHKWAMLPVILAAERAYGGIQCSFSVHVRDAACSRRLHESATGFASGSLFNELRESLEELTRRPFDRVLFERCSSDHSLPHWGQEALNAVCGPAAAPRSLAQRVYVTRFSEPARCLHPEDVLVQAYIARDNRLGEERVHIEAFGSWHKVTWLEGPLTQVVHDIFFRDRMRGQYGVAPSTQEIWDDAEWYGRWLADAMCRCARSVGAAASRGLQGILASGRQSGGLALLMLQGLYLQHAFRDAEGVSQLLGMSSVTARYACMDSGVSPELVPKCARDLSHELSTVFGTVLGSLDDMSGLPISQVVAQLAFFYAGPTDAMDMSSIFDALSARSFLQAAARLVVPFGTHAGQPLSSAASTAQASGNYVAFRALMDKQGYEGRLVASDIEVADDLAKASDAGFHTFCAGSFMGDSERTWDQSKVDIVVRAEVTRVHAGGAPCDTFPVRLVARGDAGHVKDSDFEIDCTLPPEKMQQAVQRAQALVEGRPKLQDATVQYLLCCALRRLLPAEAEAGGLDGGSLAISFGALHVPHTLEGRSALQRHDRAATGSDAWSSRTLLYQKDGIGVTFHDYLAQKAAERPYRPTSRRAFKELLATMEVSENDEFKFPFMVVLCTLRDALGADSGPVGHETAWPLSVRDGNYAWLTSTSWQVDMHGGDSQLEALAGQPVFVHVGPEDPQLGPDSEGCPGVSPWGVKADGEAGHNEQREFWDTAPMPGVPHAWRVLVEATALNCQGVSDLATLKDVLESASALVQLFRQ